MVPSGFRRFGNLCIINHFSKKWHQPSSTASNRKSIRYQWKIGFLMIHATKMDQRWSFWCQGWSNHQDQDLFWWNRASEAVEAIEVAKAEEVIEVTEVLKAGKSLMRTSESSMFWISALFWYFEKIEFGVESLKTILNFRTFSVWGCWGQPMLLF